jgi:hypothetical protein
MATERPLSDVAKDVIEEELAQIQERIERIQAVLDGSMTASEAAISLHAWESRGGRDA